jgi:hypothetical protein
MKCLVMPCQFFSDHFSADSSGIGRREAACSGFDAGLLRGNCGWGALEASDVTLTSGGTAPALRCGISWVHAEDARSTPWDQISLGLKPD